MGHSVAVTRLADRIFSSLGRTIVFIQMTFNAQQDRPRNKTVAVIGGGVGGLACAIRLAAAGFKVTLFEKNDRVGGKLNLWVAPHPHRPDERPFRFDTGPSLLTLPLVFTDLFEAAGKDVRNVLPITRLDPIARFQWSDGTRFELRAQSDDLEREVARIAPGDVEGFRQFALKGRQIWDLSAELFLYHAPEQVLSGKANLPGQSRSYWLDKLRGAFSMLTVPLRIGMFAKYSKLVDRHIRHPHLREMLYQYATYSGASPFRAPATLAVIPHAEIHFGAWYINGGMYRLAEQLELSARELGVQIRTGCPVRKILIERRTNARAKVIGVALPGDETVHADIVVANSDVLYTYRHLIDPSHRKRYSDDTLSKMEPGGTGMALLLGVEGTYPQLAHHTKFMPDDYTSDLRAMFESKTVPKDPCIYACASTRTDPTQAPDGCENLFVLCSAPALDGKIDWNVAGQQYRDAIVHTLEHRWGLTDLSKRIVVERRITPLDLESLYNANAGTIYGLGSNSLRNAFLRPPNRDRDVKGLYFAGGASHPGGGLPLVALSGKIASELVMEDFS
jgi:phytoene desaturase